MYKISIIVPTLNEAGNIRSLVERIDAALRFKKAKYEIVFVDDHSTDKTQEIIESLQEYYPIKLKVKAGPKGKAYSLLEGFKEAQYDIIGMIDADLQYPPEAFLPMLDKITLGFDIVVASRVVKETNILRQAASETFKFMFGKLLHNLDCDVQSGLKVFRKKILQDVTINPSPWTFDLEFLVKAKKKGYTIGSVDILFAKRTYGDTKINLFKATTEIALAAIKVKLENNRYKTQLTTSPSTALEA